MLNISTKYSNIDFVETAYGINLRPLALFAQETYTDDTDLLDHMHKAIAVKMCIRDRRKAHRVDSAPLQKQPRSHDVAADPVPRIAESRDPSVKDVYKRQVCILQGQEGIYG